MRLSSLKNRFSLLFLLLPALCLTPAEGGVEWHNWRLPYYTIAADMDAGVLVAERHVLGRLWRPPVFNPALLAETRSRCAKPLDVRTQLRFGVASRPGKTPAFHLASSKCSTTSGTGTYWYARRSTRTGATITIPCTRPIPTGSRAGASKRPMRRSTGVVALSGSAGCCATGGRL